MSDFRSFELQTVLKEPSRLKNSIKALQNQFEEIMIFLLKHVIMPKLFHQRFDYLIILLGNYRVVLKKRFLYVKNFAKMQKSWSLSMNIYPPALTTTKKSLIY